jgi:hypothetical protein
MAAIKKPDSETTTSGYVSAYVATRRYGISHARLLTLVGSKLVGVQLEPDYVPQFSEADIQAVLAKDPPQRKRKLSGKVPA